MKSKIVVKRTAKTPFEPILGFLTTQLSAYKQPPVGSVASAPIPGTSNIRKEHRNA